MFSAISAPGPALILLILLAVFLAAALYAVIRLIFNALTGRSMASYSQTRMQELIRHVEHIRDIGVKTNLANMEIHISGNDDIAVLGNTINEMTRKLATIAEAASDFSIGREIQKNFLPLDIDEYGNKLNSGYKDTKNAVFFGYYAEAGVISGDYFDFQEFGDRYYAIIKCDVAGKGIPAALIMIQVATMFLNYFKHWNPVSLKFHIEKAVYQINGFIEMLGYKGRFAAFTLCILDTETGELHFCNAGDNIIHILDSSEKKIKHIKLPQTPAAGVLSNDIVKSKGGYQVQTLNLNHGDILLLFTDGIEESKRRFRDPTHREIACPGGTEENVHENHSAGDLTEEMGSQRVYDIVNAVLNRSAYDLYKWHNGEGEQILRFDFSECGDGVEEPIMALIAIEKIFRCYYVSGNSEGDRVLIEKKVDAFLKKHFLQYQKYFSQTCEYPGNNSFIYYTHLREDEQYDDLSILGVKRK